MLVLCPGCNRQLDVRSHAVGSKVRCFCGALTVVEAVRPRDVPVAHCAACGAGLAAGAGECAFCGAAVRLADRGVGTTCPHCFGRLVAGARFCSGCGAAIAPSLAVQAVLDLACPRCEAEMAACRRTEGEDLGVEIVECTACAGVWLGETAFQRLLEKRKASRTPGPGIGPRVAHHDGANASADHREVRYARCPVCRDVMNRRNFARRSGVIVDWCRGHGWWFDADELQHILAFVDAGGAASDVRPDTPRAPIALHLPPARERGRAENTLVHALLEFFGELIS